ncbi:glycosyltransferase [Piscibacillus halophilus]|uniref:glycosyltransferase n=1 Tax=Piscibacillus halophilus TaxID=571933 RepID=UPI002409059C|nr:glycosyltransferase [Piscibacillus halophilus]
MPKKKIKVLFFIYYLGSGGAGRTFLNILNNIDRNRFEPILVTCNYEGNYESYLNQDIKFVKLPTKRLRSAIIPLAKLIRNERPQVVFSTIPNYNVIAIVARLLSFTKARNVVREAAFLGQNKKENLKLKLYGLFYRFSKRVVALSNGVKQNLMDKYDVNPNKIDVIYNPVELDHIRGSTGIEQIPEEYKRIYQGDAQVIVTAGRLVREKDHPTLLKAFKKVVETKKAKLVILGEGPLQDELENLASQLGISENVYFAGFQTNPYAFLQQSDLFTLTSKNEGFGHVIVEALAVGTPVVTTNCKPGAEEILENGHYGTITPVGDERQLADAIIEALSKSQDDRETIIQKGLSRANEFDAQEIVKQYEQVFEKTLK